MGGDLNNRFKFTFGFNFNPHLRMGGDRGGKVFFNLEDDFNPHLRMGGDVFISLRHVNYRENISIHTSVWEVTLINDELDIEDSISIHTSVWEVTPLLVSMYLHHLYFNPHLRMGGDFYKSPTLVSIKSHFNPHLRMGGDSRGDER